MNLTRPPGFESLTEEGWARYLERKITEEEERFRRERERTGKTVVGREAILAGSPLDVTTTYEPRGRLRPTVACKDRVLRIRALQALKSFRRAHEAARLRVVAKESDVVFPYGTYKMRLMGMPCAGPPS